MLKNLRSILRYKSFVLTVATTCFLNCALATEIARSQELDKRISINVEKKTLKETLDQISKQAHIGIIYSNAKGILKNPVTIHAEDQPLTKVLTDLLSPLKLTYEVIGDQIVVKFDNTNSRPTLQKQSEKQRFPIRGKVTDGNGSPLPGATIKIKDGPALATTDSNGEFEINNVADSTVLQVSFVGYVTKEIVVTYANYLTISLESGSNQLNEVSVVSTGYQTIPKERATGSFDLIDSTLINRAVSTNILDRLDGVTSGLIINQNKLNPNSTNITIRGTSTLFANDQPLIVLDNFPYEGDLGNINPNDIQSVTVLKDAAAASIWGVRAGNGVIVITTKKGKLNMTPQINFNANVTFSNKQDLYYTPQLTSSQYIGVETYLFDQGYYNNTLRDDYDAISPVVAILNANKNGQLTAAQMSSQLTALANDDVRSDENKYIYRKPVNQQYSLSVAGGGNANRYFISAGFDDNLQPIVSNSYNRVTLNANNTYSLIKNRLEWTSGLLFTQSTTKQNSNGFVASTPYEMLKDANGNNLPVVHGLRSSYIDTAGTGKLLDWRDIPLNDNYSNQTTSLTDYRFSNQVSLKIVPGLQLSAQYLYEKGSTDLVLDNSANSYYVRNLVNTYSQIDPVTGQVTQAIPDGDILSKDNSNYTLNTGRLQLNFDRKFGKDHQVTALAGYEISNYTSTEDAYTFYGYNPATSANGNQSIDFTYQYPQYYGYNTGQIPTGLTSQGTTDRNRSYFANASYSYKHRYIITGSARRDESNIFGVSTNQKGVPLWSTGLKWKINDEPFYKWDFLPLLALRATYGYNGNTDKSTTAYLTTLSLGSVNSFNAPYLQIINPPNPSLRWEKVGVTNLGIDFGLKNNILTGTIEYYIKNATDLIANTPVAPQSGVTQFRGNAADMRDNGVDIQFNLRILNSAISWNTMILFNYVTNKVTHYELNAGTDLNIAQGNYVNPLVGYPLYSIFSFLSAKLDSKGNPQGYLNGQLSEDYTSILNSTNSTSLIYNGSATPKYFGTIFNNFNYKRFALSVGIGYKLDYYFRRTSLNYGSLYGGNFNQADFNNRWQNPGDENHTYVPSMIYPDNIYRDEFYTYSNVLVDRADNIRLKDLRFSYALDKQLIPGLPFKTLQVYFYANNLAILWRANHDGLDPDSPYAPPLTKTFSLGLNASF